MIVRGRRGTPTVDRLATNDSGYDVQPTRFNSGMWAIIMFVGSETMFFAALFTTYFFLRGKIPAWEPVFGEKPSWAGLPLVNTIELVTSSVTMQLAVNAIRKGDRRRMIGFLIATVVNIVPALLLNPVREELIFVGGAHALFLLRVAVARQAASKQRAIDQARFEQLKLG